MEIIRYIFCFFNFIFLVSGSVLVGIGVWLALDDRLLGTFIPDLKNHDVKDYKIPTDLLHRDYFQQDLLLPETMIPAIGFACIGFGILIFFLSFVGYCGTLQDSICLLGGHSILLGLLLFLEIIAVTLFFIYKPNVEHSVKQYLTQLLDERYSATIHPSSQQARILTGPIYIHMSRKDIQDDTTSEDEQRKAINKFTQVSIFTQLFNATMENFQCCGVNNYTDFKPGKLPNGYKIPSSCCKYVDDQRMVLVDPNCVRDPTSANSFYDVGCFNKVFDSVSEYAIVGGVVVTLLQIIGIVFGIYGGMMIHKSGL